MRRAEEYIRRYQELGQTENPDETLGMALLNAHTFTQIFENEVGNLQYHLKELTIRIHRLVEDGLEDSDAQANTPLKVAQRIQHQVIWTLANLGLDNITGSAAEAAAAQKAVAQLEGL